MHSLTLNYIDILLKIIKLSLMKIRPVVTKLSLAEGQANRHNKSIINSIGISVNTTLKVGLKLQHVSTLGGHHQVELKNLLFTSFFCLM